MCVCVDTRTLRFQVIVTMMHNVIPLQNQSPHTCYYELIYIKDVTKLA